MSGGNDGERKPPPRASGESVSNTEDHPTQREIREYVPGQFEDAEEGRASGCEETNGATESEAPSTSSGLQCDSDRNERSTSIAQVVGSSHPPNVAQNPFASADTRTLPLQPTLEQVESAIYCQMECGSHVPSSQLRTEVNHGDQERDCVTLSQMRGHPRSSGVVIPPLGPENVETDFTGSEWTQSMLGPEGQPGVSEQGNTKRFGPERRTDQLYPDASEPPNPIGRIRLDGKAPLGSMPSPHPSPPTSVVTYSGLSSSAPGAHQVRFDQVSATAGPGAVVMVSQDATGGEASARPVFVRDPTEELLVATPVGRSPPLENAQNAANLASQRQTASVERGDAPAVTLMKAPGSKKGQTDCRTIRCRAAIALAVLAVAAAIAVPVSLVLIPQGSACVPRATPSRVLLIDNLDGFGRASDVLEENGFDVTEVNSELDNEYKTLLDSATLSAFGLVVYCERGKKSPGGRSQGQVLPNDVTDSLERYVQQGGNVLVTGIDTLGNPTDHNLARLVRAMDPGDRFSSDATWATANVDNFILNGSYGDYRNQVFEATGYDNDRLSPDVGAGTQELVRIPGLTGRIIFNDLPCPAGSVGYWNGGTDTDAQPDFSDGGIPQNIFLNWVNGVLFAETG